MIRDNWLYDEKIVQALKIWSKCLPSRTQNTIDNLCKLFPNISDEILERIETPLLLILDEEVNKYYIGCNSNRIENYYRSPYTNKYFVSKTWNNNVNFDPDKAEMLRKNNLELSHLKLLETEFHKIYEEYCQFYSNINNSLDESSSDNGILLSNVYCYDMVGDSFGTCFVMKHIINPYNTNIEDQSDQFIYYLDIIHNVETILSHSSGISTYKVGSTYYYGFKNKDSKNDELKFDGCKTNWTEKKCEFNTLKFIKNFNRNNMNKNELNSNINENTLNSVSIDRNSITIINNQSLYFHVLNIGKLIESVDNSVMKQIQHVLIDNLINLANDLHRKED